MAALLSNFHFNRATLNGIMEKNNLFERESPNIDNSSCCSDDTVLSVGNEQDISSKNEEKTQEKTELTFKNIESHLNAISKITNSTLDGENSRHSAKSPLYENYNDNSSSSPPPNEFFKRIYQSQGEFLHASANSASKHPDSPVDSAQGRVKSPFDVDNLVSTNNSHNNNNNEANLKFSIDNILKADFGRRITDPINIRKAKPRNKIVLNVEDSSSASGAASGKLSAASPVDLSKSDSNHQEKSSSSSSSSEGGSSQPMLWPAWVYCTRYSDRPSSGMSM